MTEIITHYFTIEKDGEAEFKDRGSKFLAIAFPIISIDDFKVRLKAIQKLHAKATHHCYAYRIGFTKDIFRVNDDGEPSGSAGRPILGQLDSKQVTDAAVVVTRYFGGSLLGVPGLINAYKMSAALSLQMMPIIQKPVLRKYRAECSYHEINEVIHFIKKVDGLILKNEMQLFCLIEFGIPISRNHEFLQLTSDLQAVNFTLI